MRLFGTRGRYDRGGSVLKRVFPLPSQKFIGPLGPRNSLGLRPVGECTRYLQSLFVRPSLRRELPTGRGRMSTTSGPVPLTVSRLGHLDVTYPVLSVFGLFGISVEDMVLWSDSRSLRI